MKRTKYRLFMVNAATLEEQPVADHPHLSKTQADAILMSRVRCPAGWFYTKKPIAD